MDTKTRLETTKFIWGILGIVLAVLFLSAGIADGLSNLHVIMGVATVIAGTISTAAVWNMEGANANTSSEISAEEKVKRERIDSVLRDLSNEELIALKQRLADGTIDDELLYQHMTLSDDGELIPMERR